MKDYPKIHVQYLTHNPFSEDLKLNIKYFYQSSQHIEAIDRIHSGIKFHNQELLQLSGEVGTGKTFTSIVIMNMLKNDKDEYGRKTNRFQPMFIEIGYSNYETLLCQIVKRATNVEVSDIIKATNLFDKIISKLKEKNQQLVLILDESQNYDKKSLDQIRQLTNINTSRKYLTILFVGQPELRDKIVSLKQLSSRIKVRQYLNNLKEDEVPEYIISRMAAAGYPKKLGNPFLPYKGEIYLATGGMPRQINTICFQIIEKVRNNQLEVITPQLVEDVIRRIDESEILV